MPREMSTCRRCGALIKWARKSKGDGMHPPLELESEANRFVIDHQGRVQMKLTYVLHECSLEDEAAYRERQRAEAEGRAAMTAMLASRTGHDVRQETEKFLRRVYELAMVHVCPKCSAAVGEPCENLTRRRKGIVAYTTSPHLERKLLIPPELHPYWSSEGYVITPTAEGES